MADETPQHFSPDAAEVVKQAFRELVAFTQFLVVKNVPEESVWFRNLLVGVLTSTLDSYRAVETGIVEMPARAAWGGRNLLELRVITTYVLQSEENVSAFMNDYLVDLKEFWEAMTRSGEEMHKLLVDLMREASLHCPLGFKEDMLEKANEMERSGPDLSGSIEESGIYEKAMDALGLNPKQRPKHGSAIAKLVQESGMFAPRFKIYSKIVHPTAFSIMATTMPGFFNPFMPLIANDAAIDMVTIYRAIRSHVEAHDFGWPG